MYFPQNGNKFPSQMINGANYVYPNQNGNIIYSNYNNTNTYYQQINNQQNNYVPNTNIVQTNVVNNIPQVNNNIDNTIYNTNENEYLNQMNNYNYINVENGMNNTNTYTQINPNINQFDNGIKPQVIENNYQIQDTNNIYNYSINNIQNQNKEEKEMEKDKEKEKAKPLDNDKSIKQINKSKNPKNRNKSQVNKLKLNEEILLNNQKQLLNKDLDIKTHFDIEVTKEKFVFPYKKVLKIAIPLLSHYEMPSGYEYKSPLLSPDGQYLSCIASLSSIDIVYVWSIEDLYWFKFKFPLIKSKVDYVAFTPDSKNLLIIYRQNNPILYELKNGNKILELEKNGEEDEREGLHCAFTTKGTYFCYTTEKSFTLWSLKNGKIVKIIKEDSPFKLLFNEYIISIKKELICEIKNFKNLKVVDSFKLKGLQSPKDILDARFTPDMSCFIYIIKQGVIKYIIKEKKFKGIQKFQPGVEKAVISDDCRFVAKTNLRNLTIYDIEKGDTIGTILKEKFNEFKIDFNNEKLIVIDNICINIHDYTDGGIPEQFVWLNKNPTRFLDVKFSPDFKFLFGLTEKNNVILYDLNTGLIIKKWQNIEKNWKNFTISEGSSYKTASTSNIFLVKIWGYITGREDSTFFGFDSYSFNFSQDGNYLACGAKNGPEIARIWNIEKGTFGSFLFVGNNSNFHTVVNLTSPEPNRLICCSIDQQPLIFDTNSKELLYKCECLYRFEEIYEIQSDQKYDVFLVKARDVKKRDIGLLYRISDGILLETYENYIVLELSKNNGIIISKCDNINGGKLTTTDLKNLSDPILNDFQIQNDKICLLNDNKCVVCSNGDEYKTDYFLLNAEDGGYIGKINFVKKADRYSENYITIDPFEQFIYFRYFEFLSPQESRNFRKKIFG